MRTIPYVLALSFVAVAAAQAAPAPAAFVTNALKGDNSEIALGNYAAQHGQSAATKEFGKVLAGDHMTAKDQMSQVAQQLNVQVPSGGTDEAKAEMQKLKGLSGTDFDKTFAADMVKDHKADIAKFTAEAKAKNGAASTAAAQQLPTLKKHLAMAERLEKTG